MGTKPAFEVIEGSRYEAERELIEKLFTPWATTHEELERVSAKLAPRGKLSLVGCADSDEGELPRR